MKCKNNSHHFCLLLESRIPFCSHHVAQCDYFFHSPLQFVPLLIEIDSFWFQGHRILQYIDNYFYTLQKILKFHFSIRI